MIIHHSLQVQFELQVGIESRLVIVTEIGQSVVVYKTFVERLFYSVCLIWLQILGSIDFFHTLVQRLCVLR